MSSGNMTPLAERRKTFMDYFILFKDQDDEMVERIKSYNANISLSLLFLAMSVTLFVVLST